MIGKRKREARRTARTVDAQSLVITQTRDRDIFRRYFESRFEPLQEVCTHVDGSLKNSDDLGTSSDAASLSDWDGLSEGDSTPGIEIIEHRKREPSTSANDGYAKKFMVGLLCKGGSEPTNANILVRVRNRHSWVPQQKQMAKSRINPQKKRLQRKPLTSSMTLSCNGS